MPATIWMLRWEWERASLIRLFVAYFPTKTAVPLRMAAWIVADMTGQLLLGIGTWLSTCGCARLLQLSLGWMHTFARCSFSCDNLPRSRY